MMNRKIAGAAALAAAVAALASVSASAKETPAAELRLSAAVSPSAVCVDAGYTTVEFQPDSARKQEVVVSTDENGGQYIVMKDGSRIYFTVSENADTGSVTVTMR